ncbi:MAG: hypothetical protein GC153_13030 [Alphaproteobacteria bacterium]|nr:hypothetical protein [Alphaproteobacteria bacterium]
MRMLTAGALALLLAACATAVGTPYGPASANKGFGYTEQEIESGRYRIAFAGDGATPQNVVEDFALLRAAQLTVANGYEWFRVIARGTEAQDKGGVNLGLGFGTSSYGRGGGVGVGVGGDAGTIGARRFFTARLEVLMGKGAKPEGPDVYDAQSVIDTIGQRTKKPGAA